jgi:hypothetical protein
MRKPLYRAEIRILIKVINNAPFLTILRDGIERSLRAHNNSESLLIAKMKNNVLNMTNT